MSSRTPPPKTPFDILISSDTLDIMKLLIPFMPASTQPMFALYIKFQELQETMRIFRLYPNGLHTEDFSEDSNESPDFIQILKPYLPEENLAMFDNISNMMHMMEMMKQMQEMSTPNEESNNGEDHSMDFLKHMLSPEQQALFESMNQMYDSNHDDEDGDADDTQTTNQSP